MKLLKTVLTLLVVVSCFLTSCMWDTLPDTPPTADVAPDNPDNPDNPDIPSYETGTPILPDPSDKNYDFYLNYKPAASYEEALARSEKFLMSGDIWEQDQAPTVSNYQKRVEGLLVKNREMRYSADGNTYYVTDAKGCVVDEIYKGGAYITLEQVAAYVFAFGDVPANHVSKKNTSVGTSPWGIYLRCNLSKFSGDTDRYPYEPVLPRISGCGGDLTYYEMDIGTTGTDCDPSYPVKDYNDGSKITRGAARIVFARYDKNGNGITDVDEKYVFYTYNHYNDFQEYLNYRGGWGEMFGNMTGGGTLSSKTDYNPTSYVQVVLEALGETQTSMTAVALPACYVLLSLAKETME